MFPEERFYVVFKDFLALKMTIVQYILLRNDLNFSKGALIAQACHSSVYSIERYRDHPDTIEYLRNIRLMTKVVLKVSG